MNPSINSGAMGKSRDFGLSHGAGKGDKNRTSNVRAFRENYDDIDWGRKSTTKLFGAVDAAGQYDKTIQSERPE